MGFGGNVWDIIMGDITLLAEEDYRTPQFIIMFTDKWLSSQLFIHSLLIIRFDDSRMQRQTPVI